MSTMKQEAKEEEHHKSQEASSPESSGKKSPVDQKLSHSASEGVPAPQNETGYLNAGQREEAGTLISDPELLNFMNPMSEAISDSTRNRLQSQNLRQLLMQVWKVKVYELSSDGNWGEVDIGHCSIQGNRKNGNDLHIDTSTHYTMRVVSDSSKRIIYEGLIRTKTNFMRQRGKPPSLQNPRTFKTLI